MSAKFELYEGVDGEYRFRLLDPSGKKLGASEGYKNKSGAENGIASVKKNAVDLNNFSVFKGSDEYFYFHLKAQNGEIILRSSWKYEKKEQANKAVAAVSLYAPTANVSDLTAVY